MIAQALNNSYRPAHTKKCPFIIGAFFDHLATGKDFSTQLLGRPWQKEFSFDKVLLEKFQHRCMQFRHIAVALRAHHDAARKLGTQVCCPFRLRYLIADHVDLVEHANPRHRLRTDFIEYAISHRELALKAGVARIDDMQQQRRLRCLLQRRLE